MTQIFVPLSPELGLKRLPNFSLENISSSTRTMLLAVFRASTNFWMNCRFQGQYIDIRWLIHNSCVTGTETTRRHRFSGRADQHTINVFIEKLKENGQGALNVCVGSCNE